MTGGRTGRWLILLLALAAAALTARLGVWQLGRAQQKLALQAQIDTRSQQPPMQAQALASAAAEAPGQHYRLVALTGRWLPRHTVYLDNRPMDGRTGFVVVTPLELAPGDVIVVQRGWVPRDMQDRTRLVPVPTPTGEVRVYGRLAPPPSALLSLGQAEPGVIRQNLDLAEYGREIGVALRPLSVQQLDDVPDAAGLLKRHWPMPAVNVATNYGYAFQWFALSALIATLYVWFQILRPRRRTR